MGHTAPSHLNGPNERYGGGRWGWGGKKEISEAQSRWSPRAPSQAPKVPSQAPDVQSQASDRPRELDLRHLALDLEPWELDLKPWELDLGHFALDLAALIESRRLGSQVKLLGA